MKLEVEFQIPKASFARGVQVSGSSVQVSQSSVHSLQYADCRLPAADCRLLRDWAVEFLVLFGGNQGADSQSSPAPTKFCLENIEIVLAGHCDHMKGVRAFTGND